MDSNSGSILLLRSDRNYNIDMITHRQLTCGICRNLLIDAYQCSCGSKFCRQCIDIYLNGTSKLCPSPAGECPVLISTVNEDLMEDIEANRRISMIQVKCPERFCHSYIEIQNVLEHLKIHQIQCPYRNLGCTKPRLRHSSINNHLHNKVLNHTQLLLDSIYHLQNDVTSMKEEIQLNKENIRTKEVCIKSILSKMEDLKSAGTKSSAEIELLNLKNEKYRRHMVKVNKKIETLSKQIHRKTHEKKIEILNTKEIGKFADHELIKYESKGELNKNANCIDRSNNRGYNPVISPFEWKPDLAGMFKEDKGKTQINRYKKWYSSPFYSHNDGYKICLRIDQGGLCSGFSIHFHIMKGEFDDSLVWPMQSEISIGIVDSFTGTGRLIKRFSYENCRENQKVNFLKPRNRMNSSCGTNYIYLKNIFHRSVHIKCAVNVDI